MRVNDRAGEIVCWICLEAISSSVMRDVLSSVEDWIAQALDLILHVELGADAVGRLLALNHALKEFQIFLHCVLSVDGLLTGISFLLHLLGGRVVSICLSLSDKLSHVVLEHLKVVRGESDLVWSDSKSLQIAHNILLKLELLIHGISVIESEDHFSSMHFGVVEIHHCGLNVTNVEITRGLRGEPGDDATVDGVLEYALCLRVIV